MNVKTEPAATVVPAPPLAYPLAVICLVLLAAGFVGLSSREVGRRVTQAEFGASWPLTVPRALLMCEYGHEITVTVDGRTYSLTPPPAHGAYDDVGPIWAPEPGTSGHMAMTPLTDAGRQLCR